MMSQPDNVGAFVRECVARDSGHSVPAGDLYREYMAWCEIRGRDFYPQRAFVQLMEGRGYQKTRGRIYVYNGLRLKQWRVSPARPEISSATFDILERMAKAHPELAGGYARSTAGVDIDLVVAVFANALHDLRRPALPAPENEK